MKKEKTVVITLIISCIILIVISIMTYYTQNIIIDIIFVINVSISLFICINLIRKNHRKEIKNSN